MIVKATAVRFVRELTLAGRTTPIIVDAELSDGRTEQVVLKLTGPQLTGHGLVHEAVSAVLAMHFGLHIAAPYVVDIPAELVTGGACPLPISLRLSHAVTPTYGSKYLHGLYAYRGRGELPTHLLPLALRTFVFDALTVNRDRGDGGNPNCLMDGNELFLIDHEQALDCDAIGSHFSLEPWKAGALDVMGDALMRHIFFDDLRGRNLDLQALEAEWSQIPMELVENIMDQLPAQWDDEGRRVREIKNYLEQLSSNLSAAFVEIGKVLS